MARSMSTHSLIFYRPGVRYLEDGLWVEGSVTTIPDVKGSLQPLKYGSRIGEVVALKAQGADSTSIKLFYTRTKLKATNVFLSDNNDYTELPDGIYEVWQVSDWDIPTISTHHYCYYLVRRPPPQEEP